MSLLFNMLSRLVITFLPRRKKQMARIRIYGRKIGRASCREIIGVVQYP